MAIVRDEWRSRRGLTLGVGGARDSFAEARASRAGDAWGERRGVSE